MGDLRSREEKTRKPTKVALPPGFIKMINRGQVLAIIDDGSFVLGDKSTATLKMEAVTLRNLPWYNDKDGRIKIGFLFS